MTLAALAVTSITTACGRSTPPAYEPPLLSENEERQVCMIVEEGSEVHNVLRYEEDGWYYSRWKVAEPNSGTEELKICAKSWIIEDILFSLG